MDDKEKMMVRMDLGDGEEDGWRMEEERINR